MCVCVCVCVCVCIKKIKKKKKKKRVIKTGLSLYPLPAPKVPFSVLWFKSGTLHTLTGSSRLGCINIILKSYKHTFSQNTSVPKII